MKILIYIKTDINVFTGHFIIMLLMSHLKPSPVFSGARIADSLVFCVAFYLYSAIMLSVFPLITPLVSSNFSYKR